MSMTRWPVCALLLLCVVPAHGQKYPDRPVRIIVPVPAGGTPDVVARTVTPGLAQILGQQMVVDNRGGAGGLIGAEIVARVAADGYTLFLSSPGAITILPHLQKQIAYDPIRDFAPIGLISSGPFLLIGHPSVPAHNLKELLALAKAQPGKLNYASAGNGTANHLAMESFKFLAGLNITHVPYKGAPQAVTDLIGGQMNLMFNSIAPVIQHIRADRLRLYGVASLKRSPQLPDAPTLNESGVPGYEAASWAGLLAPARTPKAIVATLSDAMRRVVQSAEARAQFEVQGTDPVGSTPEEFASLIQREYARHADVVKRSGTRVD